MPLSSGSAPLGSGSAPLSSENAALSSGSAPLSSGSVPLTTQSAPLSPRPSVIPLHIKEKAALYAAYIPGFAEGGVFIPSTREHRLGDDVYVLLTLLDDPQRYPVAGKVAWITPSRAAGARTQGIGIRFPKDEKSEQLRAKIETILGAALQSERSTQTF